jgi:hypothetical protein
MAAQRMSTTDDPMIDAGEVAGEIAASAKILTLSPELESWRQSKIEESLSEAVIQPWLGRAGVGARLRELEIDEALVPPECAIWLEHYREGSSMILAGGVGSGKTISAVHCLRGVYTDPGNERRSRDGQGRCQWRWVVSSSVMFVKARELYRAVFARDEEIIRRARSADVLVIDEWGGAYESAWPLAEMDGLVDDRWEDRAATIITTNQHPSDGEGCLAQSAPRSYDRLCDEPGPGVVIIDRPSLRGGR